MNFAAHGLRFAGILAAVLAVLFAFHRAGSLPRRAAPTLAANAALTPGVVICEPVPQNADKITAAFGAGCARWLFFEVGGRPKFGQTPLWSDVERAPRELGKPNLALALPDAAKLSGILGVTHAAVGTISGTADTCTLRWQLYALPAKTPLGLPVQASGTETQILARLPELAQALASRLGDAKAARPALPGIAPADMTLLGQVPWGPGIWPSSAQTKALHNLAQRFPLAGLLAMNQSLLSDAPAFTAAAQTLLAQAPDNPLVYGQIGYVRPEFLLTQTPLPELQARFPRNYALAHTDVWVERARLDPTREMAAARLAAQNAPRSPDAWLSLGYSVSRAASAIRKARTVDLISDQEWSVLRPLYDEWLSDIRHAVTLDPQFAKGWQRLAEAATFQGQDQLAKDAFWKALRLNANPADVYGWGLQMFQEKWGGDPADLSKVARLAAAEKYDSPAQTLEIAAALGGAGFPDLKKEVLQRALAESRSAVQRDPEDAFAHQTLALVLESNGLAADALPEYRAVTRLSPGSSSAHLALGLALYDAHQWDEAMEEYRAAIRLDASNEKAHANLGWGYKHKGQYDAALREFAEASRLAPADGEPWYEMGIVAEAQYHDADAVGYFQKSVALSPYYERAREQLIWACDQDKQYQTGIDSAVEALGIFPANAAIRDTLADLYLNTKDYDASIAQSQESLKRDPQDALAHEILGEAFIAQGRKAEARAEWETALTLGNAEASRAARENLAKKP